MTTFPIRIFVVIGGLIAAVAGFGFAAFLMVARLIFGSHWAAQGVFTLFAVLFFFVGVQLFAVGLLGEYVGRIYHDVRSRPRYFVQEVVGSGCAAEAAPAGAPARRLAAVPAARVSERSS